MEHACCNQPARRSYYDITTPRCGLLATIGILRPFVKFLRRCFIFRTDKAKPFKLYRLTIGNASFGLFGLSAKS